MYDLRGFGQMIADRVRMDAYTEALKRSITPGAIVVDIGTGTGVMALLACRFGAARVYAIEPNDAIEVGRASAVTAGYADRIVFIQGLSTNVKLEERVDLVVSDLRGVLPLLEGHIAAVADARQRLLAPGGTLIPNRDRIIVAPVNAPNLYQDYVEPWDQNSFGFDFSAGRTLVRNSWKNARPTPEQVVAEPKVWAEIDYQTVEDPNVAGAAEWIVDDDSIVNGWAVWFETDLVAGVGYSTGPEGRETVYGGAFFPLAEPVTLTRGSDLRVRMRVDIVGGNYVWTWNTTYEDQGPRTFRQSTFLGQPHAADSLRLRGGNQTPVVNQDGIIDRTVLDLMADGEMTIGEIADALLLSFPERFRDHNAALGRVGDLAVRYRSG